RSDPGVSPPRREREVRPLVLDECPVRRPRRALQVDGGEPVRRPRDPRRLSAPSPRPRRGRVARPGSAPSVGREAALRAAEPGRLRRGRGGAAGGWRRADLPGRALAAGTRRGHRILGDVLSLEDTAADRAFAALRAALPGAPSRPVL